MDKRKKILILVCVAVLIVGIIACIIIYNSKETKVIIVSNFSTTLTINRLGTIKEVKANNDGASFATNKLLKGKNIEEAPKILAEQAIKKEILLKNAYSYNMYVTIDSTDEKLVKKYKSLINVGVKGKLSNDAFIELEYEGCSCEKKVCTSIKSC